MLEEGLQRAFAVNAKKIMESIEDIGTLLNAGVSFTVIDKPVSAGAAASFDGIRTVVAANQVNHDLAEFLTFTHKLRLVIGQKSEQGEPNSFNNGCFSCTISSTDGGGTPAKINDNLAVAFNVL